MVFVVKFGMFWLLFIVAAFLAGYALLSYTKKKTVGIILKISRAIFILILFTISIVIIRLFIVDVFIVEGISMKNTLSPDDIVLVNKLDLWP